jgi:hypothetical protein
MKYFSLILAATLILTLPPTSADAVEFAGGPGPVATIDLGTKFHTSATLKWSFGGGAADYYTICISPYPPSGGMLKSPSFINVGPWKTSCLVKGLPPATYYWAIKTGFKGLGYSRVRPAMSSGVYRIVVTSSP